MTEIIIGIIIALGAGLLGLVTGGARLKKKEAERAIKARREKDQVLRNVKEGGDEEVINDLIRPDDR